MLAGAALGLESSNWEQGRDVRVPDEFLKGQNKNNGILQNPTVFFLFGRFVLDAL